MATLGHGILLHVAQFWPLTCGASPEPCCTQTHTTSQSGGAGLLHGQHCPACSSAALCCIRVHLAFSLEITDMFFPARLCRAHLYISMTVAQQALRVCASCAFGFFFLRKSDSKPSRAAAWSKSHLTGTSPVVWPGQCARMSPWCPSDIRTLSFTFISPRHLSFSSLSTLPSVLLAPPPSATAILTSPLGISLFSFCFLVLFLLLFPFPLPFPDFTSFTSVFLKYHSLSC